MRVKNTRFCSSIRFWSLMLPCRWPCPTLKPAVCSSFVSVLRENGVWSSSTILVSRPAKRVFQQCQQHSSTVACNCVPRHALQAGPGGAHVQRNDGSTTVYTCAFEFFGHVVTQMFVQLCSRDFLPTRPTSSTSRRTAPTILGSMLNPRDFLKRARFPWGLGVRGTATGPSRLRASTTMARTPRSLTPTRRAARR